MVSKKLGLFKYYLVLLWYGIMLIRRVTLCRLGWHKRIIWKETLALGEVFSQPMCGICEKFLGKAAIQKPYAGDGCLLLVNEETGHIINYGGVYLEELQRPLFRENHGKQKNRLV